MSGEQDRELLELAAKAAGIAQAAAFIQKKADYYAAENCSEEYDTGALVYRYGQAGEDYHHTLIELADEVAALAVVGGASYENVGTVYTMEALIPGGKVRYHASLTRSLPSGTKLYARTATHEDAK